MTQGPKTREVYEGHLRNWMIPMLGDVAVANLDRAMVRGFVAEIRRLGKSQGTVDGCVKVLRLILAFAVDAGAIKSNPAARLRMDRQQRQEMHFLSENDVVLLAFAAHPRWVVHYNRVHASWVNQIALFFSILQRKVVREGNFTSRGDLVAKLLAFIRDYDETARPFCLGLLRRSSQGRLMTTKYTRGMSARQH